MFRQVLILLSIVSLFASWLINRKNNNNADNNIGKDKKTMTTVKYTAVPGFFLHDDEPEGPDFRAHTERDLGLIRRAYETDPKFNQERPNADSWERFQYFVEHLNELGQGNASWKLIYLIRHGEGYHNVKEAEVGRAEWERNWSRVDGDDLNNWADARLTLKGISQASDLQHFWSSSDGKIPMPQSVYTSPLARCLETTNCIYSSVGNGRVYRPIIKEKLRERFGVHTCDRRSTKTWIGANYPRYKFERDFSESDELWKADQRETEDEVVGRARSLLHDIWQSDKSTYISLTAHSGFIRALYTAIGHRQVWVAAGQMMPVFIKAEVIG
ncbi:phosphoglycerate mutase-like protein [Annulohypoxylon bovei var. microspora]|nr:phosphoglycerate mutase-like protein [Annulohypoxylon bovei var. microspora]